MSTGLYSGTSGLALGVGLYAGNPGLWGGSAGLITGDGASLYLNFLAGAPLDPRVTFTRGTTATFVGSNGFIQTAAIDAPRFDYDPVTLAAKGLLIEEQRTNLLLQSQTLDNASWSKSNGTITANTIASPDGTTNADAFIENTAASVFHFMAQSIAKAASNIQYTVSFYVKNKGRQVAFSFNSGSQGVAGRVNPATGTVTAAIGTFGTGWTAGSLTMTDAGNGWYRVVIVATSDTSTTATFQLSLHNGTTNVYTGDGVSGAYIWGAQMEAAAFPTSYIPTVASTVARGADVASMTGTNFSSWYNQSAGTFVVAVQAAPNATVTAGQNSLYVSDATGTNNINMRRTTSSFGASGFTTAGVVVADIQPSAVIGASSIYKTSTAFQLNNINGATNSVLGIDDTSATIPVVDRLFIGSNIGGAGHANGHIRQISYYNTRLTNATLQALTA